MLALLGLSACAVPLAPGYQIVKESREVRFVPGERPELHISARYTLKNSGTTDLEFIDIAFPEETTYGRKDLRLEWDGHAAQLASLPEEYQVSEPTTMRLPVDRIWKRGEQHQMSVEYTFRSPEDDGDRLTIGAKDFHLASRGWAPVPEPPKHFLAPFPSRPDRMSYTVVVPRDFLVLAGGRSTRRNQSDTGTEYRFELRKKDMTPSVIAGQYVASSPEAKASNTIFWTRQPLKEDPANAIRRITIVWNALENDFGPLDKSIRVPHIVESTGLRERMAVESGPAAAPFPGGVLVSPELFSIGLASDSFQERVAHELAHNWFGTEVFFGRYTALGLGEGLPEYATIVAEEAQKGAAGRRGRVVDYLHEYDEARKGAEENPLGVTALTDSREQQRIALAKAALFFVAIEDACGEKPMRDGLKQMIALLRGQEVNYDVLRSELEESSGKQLADLFRVWLNEKGIPADFRARYEGSSVAAQIANRE